MVIFNLLNSASKRFIKRHRGTGNSLDAISFHVPLNFSERMSLVCQENLLIMHLILIENLKVFPLTKLFLFFAFFVACTTSSSPAQFTAASFPEGWAVNTASMGGKPEYMVIDDPAASHDGNICVYLKGHLMTNSNIYVSDGDEIEVSFYAKDPEEKNVGASLYLYNMKSPGSISNIGGLAIVTAKAGKEWTKVEGRVVIPAESGGKRINAVRVAISTTGAYLDSAWITHLKTSELKNFMDAFLEGTRKEAKSDWKGALKDFNVSLQLLGDEKEKSLAKEKIKEIEERISIEEAREKGEKTFVKTDVLVKEGDYKKAVAEFEKMKNIQGMKFVKEIALFNIADIYAGQKDYAGVHKTYREIFDLPGLTGYYLVYGLFRQSEVFLEQKEYQQARNLYAQAAEVKGASENHLFMSKILTADTYRYERNYSKARNIYEALLMEQETSNFPHESYRRDLIDRLENIEELQNGQEEKNLRQKRAERVNIPKYALYVSLEGSDASPGTKEKPFATIKRVQEEVRRIKAEKGIPEGGIAVCLREGKYFITESIVFGKEDSGTENSPVVYRSYPGEEVRIIGGRDITGFFSTVTDPEILKRLPEKTRAKVMVADLKAEGITDYGEIPNGGGSYSSVTSSAMELFFNGKPMPLARWPKEGWLHTEDVIPGVRGKFTYPEDYVKRFKKWMSEEKDIRAVGFFENTWNRHRVGVVSIDTEKRIISLAPTDKFGRDDPNLIVRKDRAYYFENVLSELSAPGEFYIDRETGKLYFYPPGTPSKSEVLVSTLNAPLIKFNDTSNVVFFGLTLEATMRDALEIKGGTSNLIAGCKIRNTGKDGIRIEDGWNHEVIGCDIYHTAQGGILILNSRDDEWKKLIPHRHVVENNHIHHFNRFDGGYRPAVSITSHSIGTRISHNLMHDSPHQAINFTCNDHIIEFNEIYDVLYEPTDAGAIYTYGEPRYLMNRGNVMRYNFLHHITQQSSPTKATGVVGIYVDCLNGGMTSLGNILHLCSERAMLANGPDTRIENSLFINNNMNITFVDTSWILGEKRVNIAMPPLQDIYRKARYKQPPWSFRYPQMVKIFEDRTPVGRIERNSVKRNICTNIPFITKPGSVILEDNFLGDNREKEKPLFTDASRMDFRIRPGDPVFGITSVEPIPLEKIGLYEDPLRASWPVERTQAGKYFKKESFSETPAQASSGSPFPPLKKVSEPLEYTVKRRTVPIKIDGKLDAEEWEGDKSRAVRIEQQLDTGKKANAKGFAWLLYDDEYLYIGIENIPDSTVKADPADFLSSSEITIEGQFSTKTLWWKGLPLGPLYTFTGYPNGRVTVHNISGIPPAEFMNLENWIEYKAFITNPEKGHWTAEWKIPLSDISISPETVKTSRFNIGGPAKNNVWFGWVATGGSLWRVDNGGILRFAR